MAGRGAFAPLAGIGSVHRNNLHLLPWALEPGTSDLERGWRGEHPHRVGAEFGYHQTADAVAQGVAGSQYRHFKAVGTRLAHPLRHLREQAVHGAQFRTGWQVGRHPIEHAAHADYQPGSGEFSTRRFRQAGPAIVEYAHQGTDFLHSPSSTMAMGRPSKSQASTVSRYSPG